MMALWVVLGGSAESRAAAMPRTADVLIVEKPEMLTVYNRYQQTATTEDRTRLHPFEPMVIVNQRELMSDGFSTAMQVLVEDHVYYLILEKPGVLAGARQAGSVKILNGVEVLKDTLAVNKDGVTLEIPGASAQSLSPGTLMERLFESNGHAYVRLLHEEESGWVSRNGGSWSIYHTPDVRLPRDVSRIEPEISRKIEETNTVLRQLYSSFDRETGLSLSPPSWSLRALSRSLVCTFHGSSQQYTRSINYLAKDLENSLIGSGCHVETN